MQNQPRLPGNDLPTLDSVSTSTERAGSHELLAPDDLPEAEALEMANDPTFRREVVEEMQRDPLITRALQRGNRFCWRLLEIMNQGTPRTVAAVLSGVIALNAPDALLAQEGPDPRDMSGAPAPGTFSGTLDSTGELPSGFTDFDPRDLGGAPDPNTFNSSPYGGHGGGGDIPWVPDFLEHWPVGKIIGLAIPAVIVLLRVMRARKRMRD